MATKSDSAIDALFRSAQSSHEKVDVLRRVKNYITGHDLRKRQYVQDGLIVRLADIVEELNHGKHEHQETDTDNAAIWIQVVNITCVLAHGGPKFVHSILNSTLLPGLVLRLSNGDHSRESLAILNALNTIADNLPLSAPNTWNVDKRLAELLYGHASEVDFARLLSPASITAFSGQIFGAAAALICKTCTIWRHRAAMVHRGALDVLCKRFASLVVMQGFVIPHQNSSTLGSSDFDILSQPASSHAQLAIILETIAALIEGIKDHCYAFMFNSTILQVLPESTDDSPAIESRETWLGGQDVPTPITTLDSFLPTVPDNDVMSIMEKSNFPPLGTSIPTTKRRQSSLRPTTPYTVPTPTELGLAVKRDHQIIPWLLYVARTYHGRDRLVASRLLAILLREGLIKPSRSRTFGTLLVPILIRMLDGQGINSLGKPLLLTGMHYSKAVPAVIASLIQDDPEMQRIAFEAKAIPKLAVALRSTFEQADSHKPQLWTPEKVDDQPKKHLVPGDDLSRGSPLLNARHMMTYREGLLRALAAIAPSDDSYRKEICDQGVLVQIMLALEPFQTQRVAQQSNQSEVLTSGNSTSTLLAACNAVRALTRSVTALRTKLVDADVGKAIMRLMYNSDPEVRIAATRVIANLAMDFSPLKATISEPDLVKKLCEQAHSANARLRLESIWALKSLVLNAPNKLKRDIIDELGPNWIKHLIETDPHDIPPGVVIGLSEREYPPRTSRDIDHISDDVVMDEDLDSESSITGLTSNSQDMLEQYNKHTVDDDLAIQEQLMDLIRNLFCGEAASEIVDYLVGEIGHDTFLKILVDRLMPHYSNAVTKLTTTKSLASKDMIAKVLYVVMHVAACAPRFRNMISQNSTLMKVVAGFCTHTDPGIRVQCCWIIINLTYEDDSSDREACRIRALEIQKAGFQGHMRRLESDPEPNVRERAKTAVHLLLKMM